LPAGLLLFFFAFPQFDLTFQASIFHFYIVTFSTFVAAVVAIVVLLTLGDAGAGRHILLATAFAAMAAIFLVHGLTTPGVLIAGFHPGVQWAAWLTLFVGGFLFALAGFDDPERPLPARLLRRTVVGTVVFGLSFAAVAAFAPDWLSEISEWADPWHVELIFYLSLGAWLLAAYRLRHIWQQTQNQVDGLMALIALWFALGTISMHKFPLFQLSWWLYHVLILLGASTAMVALTREYEQLRRFSLTRYYAMIGLIFTAAVALLTSYLFAQVVYEDLISEMAVQANRVGQNLVRNVARDLPSMVDAQDLQRLAPVIDEAISEQIVGLDMNLVTIYDENGRRLLPNNVQNLAVNLDEPRFVQAALSGETYTTVIDELFLQTYTPIPNAQPEAADPIGVVVTRQPAPGLQLSVMNARLTGLIIMLAAQGLLFLALLFVVRRADRLITLRTDELAKAYTDLRAAESMRDDLVSMIVHDLRSPLTAILANLDLLKRLLAQPDRREEQVRFLRGAHDSAQRMNEMVGGLLDVSKLEAGRLRPNLRPVSATALLQERREAFAGKAAAEEKEISLRIADNLPPLLADETLIQRVLDNLISNALKYTHRGGQVALSAWGNGTAVLFSVSDDGEGVPPAFADRIFDKFVQVTDEAGNSRRQGSGLGLAFCKLVVEAHGGRIWLESQPELGGSQFTFILPLNQDSISK